MLTYFIMSGYFMYQTCIIRIFFYRKILYRHYIHDATVFMPFFRTEKVITTIWPHLYLKEGNVKVDVRPDVRVCVCVDVRKHKYIFVSIYMCGYARVKKKHVRHTVNSPSNRTWPHTWSDHLQKRNCILLFIYIFTVHPSSVLLFSLFVCLFPLSFSLVSVSFSVSSLSFSATRPPSIHIYIYIYIFTYTKNVRIHRHLLEHRHV